MIETGMTHTVEKTVTADMTAKAIGSGGLEVLGTPYMMALMECAAMWCVQNEDGLIGEGTHTRAVIDNARFQQKCSDKLHKVK